LTSQAFLHSRSAPWQRLHSRSQQICGVLPVRVSLWFEIDFEFEFIALRSCLRSLIPPGLAERQALTLLFLQAPTRASSPPRPSFALLCSIYPRYSFALLYSALTTKRPRLLRCHSRFDLPCPAGSEEQLPSSAQACAGSFGDRRWLCSAAEIAEQLLQGVRAIPGSQARPLLPLDFYTSCLLKFEC
jgi:hypothetical protein